MTTAFQIFTQPSQQALDTAANVLSGATLTFTLTGTSTPTNAYSDSTLSTPVANPLSANAAGVFIPVFLDPLITYRVVLKTQAGAVLQTWDPANENLLAYFTQALIGSILYPISSAETSAGLTNSDLNRVYPYGNLARFKCDMTGGTVNDVQIANALAAAAATGGTGYIFHPGGSIQHASQVLVPAGVSVFGFDRKACEFFYTGTSSAWRYTSGLVNDSGYANVHFRSIKIRTANASNNGAGIELNAGGYAYFEIYDVWINGSFDSAIILDAVELCRVHHCLIDTSSTTSTSIWIVNGPDRSVGQVSGFSNIITISDNQISADGGTGIVDDGGSVHVITGNNFNEHSMPARFAGTDSLVLSGNSFETTEQSATANVLFTNTTMFGGANVGPCTNGVIHACAFYGDMSASGACLRFKGALHSAFHITGCEFGNRFGRGGAIDVEKLRNSFCGYNYDVGQVGMEHFVNAHNDADGNTLLPPQNGFSVTLGISGVTYGDTRYQHIFHGGAKIKTGAEFNETLVGSKTFDWPNLASGSSTNTTVTVTGAALGDVVLGVSMSLNITSGLWLQGQVESANTVRVVLRNDSGGAVDLASGVLKVLVAHAS